MSGTPDLLARARKGKRDAVVELLRQQYPFVYRVAFALAGREDVGRGIVRQVMRQCMPVLHKWNDSADAQRWFIHHVLLTARRAARHEPDLAGDPLIRGVETTSAYYPAFVRALRALPIQQREAYILHHGEHLDPRRLAVSMDCSTEAAANHLREATNALSAYAGDFFPAFTAQLSQAYARLTPSDELILPAVRKSVRRYLLPRKLVGLTKNVVKLGIIAGVILVGWKIVPMIRIQWQ